MKIASLFAGIGGPALAGRWMGWEQKWFAEVDPYASALLAKNFPGVPNHGDVRLIDGSRVQNVDILTGGFPCQDISIAGKGEGINGARSGLWSEYARLIGELQPRYVVAENSPYLRTRGLDRILKDLGSLGYDAEWHCIPAASLGAPHRRDRIWVIAYPHREQLRLESRRGGGSGWEDSVLAELYGSPRLVADAQGVGAGSAHQEAHPLTASGEARAVSLGGGERDGGRSWETPWSVEPDVGRVADGVPAGVDRLRCLGNSIVPQIAHLIFRAIAHYENSK